MKTYSRGTRWMILTTAGCLAACLVAPKPLGGAQTSSSRVSFGGRTFDLHPVAFKDKPDVPSPYTAEDGIEVLIARTEQDDYAILPVTITPGITIRPWEAPLEIDREDFPCLARAGRHSETELESLQSITGRSLAEITELGRPGRLSTSGFMAEDEDILSVMKGDNRLVAKLGLTHPELARPLLHVCNLIRVLYRETGASHTNVVFYGGKRLTLEVTFSRGGQKSIFNDGLDGAWTITIRREIEEGERTLIDKAYAHLDAAQRETIVKRLTEMLTGEMQPFYIYRYGFYEGHTAWRTNPIAIAFMFGLKPIEKIEAAFAGQLHQVLTRHFVQEKSTRRLLGDGRRG